ncbi:cytochrome p450 [Colletotrichum incanum]|uniref:Cytochrome p450 n=1 Tax=Colletotrichum incanum TaxID=1573173 RepID=A0A167DHN0_COLIC|nr:cytochrome p450 [Colletotrichum incanum]OHW92842.1 cytochrome p450 [Colletotrichum incanum]
MNTTSSLIVDSTLLTDVAHRWPVAMTTLLACVFAFILQMALKSDPLANIPIVGAEYGGQEKRRKKFMCGEAMNLYLDGYKKFKEQAFRITTSMKLTNIAVAPKFMNELKKLPDDVLSVNKAIEESMQSKYTGVLTDADLLIHTVKAALTPALTRINPIIFEEVVNAMRIELPQSGEWTEVNIVYKLMRIVAMVSGRIFIGPELCRNEGYIDVAVNYTVDLMIAIQAIANIQPYLRPFLAASRPEVKKVQRRVAEADMFLRPVVKERRKAAEVPNYQKPDDMLQWMMESQKNFGQKGDRELARYELALSVAAIHTTTVTITNALYTLAAMPEFFTVLRQDVQQALAETSGVFTNSAMQNMKKVDSFLKECMRCHALTPASFQRKVLKSFTLSNGQVIPAGSVIEVPSIGIYTDEEFFPDADKFDPLRFYKIRQEKKEQETGSKQAEVAANAQFVSVGQSSLTFGYGRHACPGRFFAVNEIKMIMATFLLNYDLMNVAGSRERYPNVVSGPMNFPDPNKTILLRKM